MAKLRAGYTEQAIDNLSFDDTNQMVKVLLYGIDDTDVARALAVDAAGNVQGQ